MRYREVIFFREFGDRFSQKDIVSTLRQARGSSYGTTTRRDSSSVAR